MTFMRLIDHFCSILNTHCAIFQTFNFIFMYVLFIFPKYNMCSMKIRQKDLKLKPVFIVEVKYILKLDFIF